MKGLKISEWKNIDDIVILSELLQQVFLCAIAHQNKSRNADAGSA